MPHLIRFSCCALLALAFISTGCQQNEEVTSEAGTASTPQDKDDHGAIESDDSETKVTDPGQQILGSWKVDADATREGWGDRRAEQEKRLLDHLGMGFEFKKDMLTWDQTDGSFDIHWEIKDKSEQTLNIVLAESKDGLADESPVKKVKVRLMFESADRVLFQSSEGDFKEDLILIRVQ